MTKIYLDATKQNLYTRIKETRLNKGNLIAVIKKKRFMQKLKRWSNQPGIPHPGYPESE